MSRQINGIGEMAETAALPVGETRFDTMPVDLCRTAADGGLRGAGTILLVDDEQVVQAVVRQVLERAGFSVISALDGAQGVELFRNHANTISLVILDLTMPGKSGHEVFAEIREMRTEIPVIFSSGYGEEEISASLPANSMVGFISKPYRAGTLLDKVREAVKTGNA